MLRRHFPYRVVRFEEFDRVFGEGGPRGEELDEGGFLEEDIQEGVDGEEEEGGLEGFFGLALRGLLAGWGRGDFIFVVGGDS